MNKKEGVMQVLHLLVFILLIISSISIAAAQSSDSTSTSEWTMFQRHLNHTGYFPGNVTLQGLELLWKYDTTDSLYTSPIAVNGILYVTATLNYTVYAFNITDGSIIWRYYSNSSIDSTPAYASDRLYFSEGTGGNGCNVTALNATTGGLLWLNHTRSDSCDSSPSVADGRVYAATYNGMVYCFDAVTGATLWYYDLPYSVFKSSPAIVDGVLYIGTTAVSSNNYMFALDALTGTQLWNYSVRGSSLTVGIQSSPVISGDYLYTGRKGSDYGFALNISANGSQIWNHTTGGGVYGTPAVANDIVFFADSTGNVSAFNATTGDSIWYYDTKRIMGNSNGGSTPAVTDNGILFVGSQSSLLYAFNASTGQNIWNYTGSGNMFDLSGTVIIDDYIFINDENGEVYAFIKGIAPNITFAQSTTQSGQYPSQNFIFANVTSTDTHLANITIYLFNSSSLVRNVTNSSSPMKVNFTNLPDGVYYLNATANDTAGNINATETRMITLGSTCSPPVSGDWIINESDYIVCNGMNITVFGADAAVDYSLVIKENATLVINSSNLTLSAAIADSPYLSIEGNGTLIIGNSIIRLANLKVNGTAILNISLSSVYRSYTSGSGGIFLLDGSSRNSFTDTYINTTDGYTDFIVQGNSSNAYSNLTFDGGLTRLNLTGSSTNTFTGGNLSFRLNVYGQSINRFYQTNLNVYQSSAPIASFYSDSYNEFRSGNYRNSYFRAYGNSTLLLNNTNITGAFYSYLQVSDSSNTTVLNSTISYLIMKFSEDAVGYFNGLQTDRITDSLVNSTGEFSVNISGSNISEIWAELISPSRSYLESSNITKLIVHTGVNDNVTINDLMGNKALDYSFNSTTTRFYVNLTRTNASMIVIHSDSNSSVFVYRSRLYTFYSSGTSRFIVKDSEIIKNGTYTKPSFSIYGNGGGFMFYDNSTGFVDNTTLMSMQLYHASNVTINNSYVTPHPIFGDIYSGLLIYGSNMINFTEPGSNFSKMGPIMIDWGGQSQIHGYVDLYSSVAALVYPARLSRYYPISLKDGITEEGMPNVQILINGSDRNIGTWLTDSSGNAVVNISYNSTTFNRTYDIWIDGVQTDWINITKDTLIILNGSAGCGWPLEGDWIINGSQYIICDSKDMHILSTSDNPVEIKGNATLYLINSNLSLNSSGHMYGKPNVRVSENGHLIAVQSFFNLSSLNSYDNASINITDSILYKTSINGSGIMWTFTGNSTNYFKNTTFTQPSAPLQISGGILLSGNSTNTFIDIDWDDGIDYYGIENSRNLLIRGMISVFPYLSVYGTSVNRFIGTFIYGPGNPTLSFYGNSTTILDSSNITFGFIRVFGNAVFMANQSNLSRATRFVSYNDSHTTFLNSTLSNYLLYLYENRSAEINDVNSGFLADVYINDSRDFSLNFTNSRVTNFAVYQVSPARSHITNSNLSFLFVETGDSDNTTFKDYPGSIRGSYSFYSTTTGLLVNVSGSNATIGIELAGNSTNFLSNLSLLYCLNAINHSQNTVSDINVISTYNPPVNFISFLCDANKTLLSDSSSSTFNNLTTAYLELSGSANATFNASLVRYYLNLYGNNRLNFTGTPSNLSSARISVGDGGALENIYLYGSVDMPNTIYQFNVSAKLHRFYPMYVKNLITGSPLANALIEIKNGTQLLDSDTTGSDGYADLNLTWNSSTYQGTYDIWTTASPAIISGSINVTKDTPITVYDSPCSWPADGDWNITDGAYVVCEDEDINIHGSINIRNFSTLWLKRSNLTLNISTNFEHNINITDASVLLFADSRLRSNSSSWGSISANDNSSLNISNSNITGFYIYANDLSVNMLFNSSSDQYIFASNMSTNTILSSDIYQGYLQDNSTNAITNTSYSLIYIMSNSNNSLINLTEVGSVYFMSPYDSHTLIRNCSNMSIYFVLARDMNTTIRGLYASTHVASAYANGSGYGFKAQILDTAVYFTGVEQRESSFANISSSGLTWLDIYSNSSTFVSDTNITVMDIYSSGNNDINITGLRIFENTGQSFASKTTPFSLNLSDVYISNLEIYSTDTTRFSLLSSYISSFYARGNSTNQIADTNMSWVDAEGKSRLSVSNITVTDFQMIENSLVNFTLPRSSITSNFWVSSNYAWPSMYGYVNLPPSFVGLSGSSNFTRYYPVFVYDASNNPVSGALVNVTNASGSVLFSASTDASGFVDVILNFSNQGKFPDYRNNYTITAYWNPTLSQNISIITDTPIIFSQEEPCSPPAASDWVITDTVRCVNMNITLGEDKNLNIMPGGSLLLQNTSLWVKMSANWQSNITVYSGASLNINATLGDGSLINSTNSFSYRINLNSGSNVSIEDSEISRMGDTSGGIGIFVNSTLLRFEDDVLSDAATTGILLASDNNTLRRIIFRNNIIGVVFQNSTNSIVIDSVISSNTYDVAGFSTGHNTLLNTTFDRTKVNVLGDSLVEVKWYFDVNVTNSSGGNVAGVNVTVYFYNGSFSFNGSTDASGKIGKRNVTEFIKNSTAVTYLSPYTINTTKLYYELNTTKVNVTNNAIAQIFLNWKPVMVSAASPSYLGPGSSINVTTVSYDPDHDSMVLFVCNSSLFSPSGCGEVQYCNSTGSVNLFCNFTLSALGKHPWYAVLYDNLSARSYNITSQNVTITDVYPFTIDNSTAYICDDWHISSASILLNVTNSSQLPFNHTYYCIYNAWEAPCTDYSVSFANKTNVTVNCTVGSACQKKIRYFSFNNESMREPDRYSNPIYLLNGQSSSIDDTCLCDGMNMSNLTLKNAHIADGILVSGAVSYGTKTWYAPFSMENICLGISPFPVGTVTFRPSIVKDGANITVYYHAGVGYNVTINITEMQKLDSNGAGISLLDNGISPDEEKDDGTYSESYLISASNSVGDGVKRITAQAEDRLGNLLRASGNITLDNTVPYGSIMIHNLGVTGIENSSQEVTSSTTVILLLNYSDAVGIDSCRYSNEDLNYSSWEACSSTKAWILSDSQGIKTVYYQVKDLAGNINTISDMILYNLNGSGLDTTPPQYLFVYDDGNATNDNTSLHASWAGYDPESENLDIPLLYYYKIGTACGLNDVVDWQYVGANTSVTAYNLTLAEDVMYYFTVAAQNSAPMNLTNCSDGITVITLGPTITFLTSLVHANNTWNINSSNTTSIFVWNATAVNNEVAAYSYMLDTQINGTPDNIPDGDIANLSNQTTVTVTDIGDGTFYFHVKAKDQAGNWGNPATYIIKVDTSPPSAPHMTAWFTNVSGGMVSYNWSVSADSDSGILDYELQVSNTTNFAVILGADNVSTTYGSINIGSVTGIIYGRVRARNNAYILSLWSSEVSTISDTTPPDIFYFKPNNCDVIISEPTIAVKTDEKAQCFLSYGVLKKSFRYTNSTYHEIRIDAATSVSYTITCYDQAWNSDSVSTTIGPASGSASISGLDVDSPANYYAGQIIAANVTFNSVSGVTNDNIRIWLRSPQGSDDEVDKRLFALADLGICGEYELTFPAPQTSGQYTLIVGTASVNQTQTIYIGQTNNPMIKITYTPGASGVTDIVGSTKVVYGTESGATVGLGSDVSSVIPSTTSVELTTYSPDGSAYIFLTPSAGFLSDREKYLKKKKFEDLINPSFGYAIDDTYLITTQLSYDDVNIIGNRTVQSGRYNLVIRNIGTDESGNVILEMQIT